MKVARLVFQSGDFSSAKEEIKKNGLTPRLVEANKRWELSVLDSTQMNKSSIFDASKILRSDKEPKAAFEFADSCATDLGLSVEKDGIGHDDHCNILNWPSRDEDRAEDPERIALTLNWDLEADQCSVSMIILKKTIKSMKVIGYVEKELKATES